MNNHYLLYGSERYALAILRPVQKAILARGDHAMWFFDGPGGEDLSDDEKQLHTVDEVRQFNPIAIITPSNAVPHFFPGVKVQTFHGFDAGKPRHVYIRGFFDLYCTTGPRDTVRFQALSEKLGHFTVTQTGWPKLDPFNEILNGKPAPVKQPPTILYCSTFSPSWSGADILFDQIKRLSREDRWRWIVTFHPKMNQQTVDRYKTLENEYLTFTDSIRIPELFDKADLMCCDTSSAVQEFLLTGKPVVTFKNRRPGEQLIDIDDPENLESAIERALSRPPELMQAIEDYIKNLHPYHDGKSGERILKAIDDFVAAGGKNRKRKPLNLLRKYKIRKRLNYWGR